MCPELQVVPSIRAHLRTPKGALADEAGLGECPLLGDIGHVRGSLHAADTSGVQFFRQHALRLGPDAVPAMLGDN